MNRRVLTIALLCLVRAQVSSAHANLLDNSGFETGSVAPWLGATTAEVVPAAAHGGAYGVRLPSAQLLTQGWVRVIPGRTYVVSTWFRWSAFAGSDWGYPTVDVVGVDWQPQAAVTGLHTRYPQNTWSKIALSFVAKTTAVQVRFGVYGPRKTVDLAFDDLQLSEKLGNLPPSISPTASITAGGAPLAVQLHANGDDSDGAIVSFRWDFGDGSLSPLASPSHTYTQRGSYTVTLSVWDNDAASTTRTLTIQVTTDDHPSITIGDPTSRDTHTTTATHVTLSGSATAPVGRAIQRVVWDNLNTDVAGIVSTSPATNVVWSTPAIALKPGTNEILMTATDSTGAVMADRVVVSRSVSRPVVSNVIVPATTVRVFEKFTVQFDLETVADTPFFSYDPAPPPGVPPRTGVTVEGVFRSPSGRVLRQPGFLQGAVRTTERDGTLHYEETGRQHWAVRLSPLEVGTYGVSLLVTDASGSVEAPAGTFTASPPERRGFVRVSRDDPRYFEFTNRDLFFPVGPANGPNYESYAGTGLNFERPWMAGHGAYSTNWARWMRTDLTLGNEGFDSPLTFHERYPSHELSREIFAPGGNRIWMGQWGDESYYATLKAGTTYLVKVRLRVMEMVGPVDRAYPYGFMIKTHGFPLPTIEADLRARPSIIPVITRNGGWHTVAVTYTAPSDAPANPYFSLLLDNVSTGHVYIDQFSVRDMLEGEGLGGELIRHSRADLHTYVEQRPAAHFDRQVEQGEANGVFFKYVVQDKRDWVPNHLSRLGVFEETGDGYFQEDGTKAKWLQQQWWRYVVARWGYSTAVHSWELCNEADPNGRDVWRHAQDFARFMHQTDAHPHLATVSFWCCWSREFWGDHATYPDVDYADLHEYTKDSALGLDTAEWLLSLGAMTNSPGVGKPVIVGETGIGYSGHPYFEYLGRPNAGVWFHNLLWAQLNGLSGLTVPNYWWSEHRSQVNLPQIARPFAQFVSRLDVNRGGYQDVAATVSNVELRVLGQKNVPRHSAYLWIRNRLHNWHNVMGVLSPVSVTPQSGTVTMQLAPNTPYLVEWWNTSTGEVQETQTLTSAESGNLVLTVTNLTSDVAVRILGPAHRSLLPERLRMNP